MTTIGNTPSTTAVALFPTARITDPAACQGQHSGPAPTRPTGARSAGLTVGFDSVCRPAARCAGPGSGPR